MNPASALFAELQSAVITVPPMRELFARDARRFTRFSVQACGLLLDYSKNRITEKIMGNLVKLALESDLPRWRKAMFSGEEINTTEKRAVLHTALRLGRQETCLLQGKNIVPEVHRVLDQMEDFTDKVRSGSWLGYTGKPVRHVVNIGIGGSDLGPKMAVEALDFYRARHLQFSFVSNVDATQIARVLERADPETTLFLIASKTFTTQETLANAHTARAWFLGHGATEKDIARHFVAMSTNEEAVRAFGIDPQNMFIFWDWVGGRYSLWSSIGLSLALAIGMDAFRELLAGARDMDEHFCTAPLEKNIPVILALLGIWYRDFHGFPSHAILPYEQYLALLPGYLQQADMESNGKSVTRTGAPVMFPTGPLVWGEAGTNGQHAFYQLLHQGSTVVPCDFLAGARALHPLGEHHQMLLANFLAQSEALMHGRTLDEARAGLPLEGQDLAAHKTFPGNRPSNSLLYEILTPRVLGSLLAMYEHKIFTQGVLWEINSFDQMGVELGKEMAGVLLPELQGARQGQHDSSTLGLLTYCRAFR